MTFPPIIARTAVAAVRWGERQRRIWLRRPSGRRVDFLICGTQKGGTSALDVYLRQHPAIAMADVKEVHYFDDEREFSGTPRTHHYHCWFSPRPQHRLLGEATPIYMYWRPAAERIRAYNAAMKLIVVLRNPIERAYSHWNMERQRGLEPLPFSEAIRCEEARCAAVAPLQHRVFSYVDRGRYARQLRHLLSFFPREQLLVLRSEDLKLRPAELLADVCRWLGVEPLERVHEERVHVRRYESPLAARDWDFLAAKFAADIAELETLLGWDCRAWLTR